MILFSVLYLIFWCHIFLLPGSEHGAGREFFICEDAAFVTPVCPRLVFGNAVPAHFVKYCIQPLRDRTFWYDFTVSPRRWEGTAFFLGKYQISDVKYIWNNSYLNCGWRWKWRMIIAINFQCKQSFGFLSNFCGLDKSTIPPVYLQLSTTLYRPSWAAVHDTFPVHVLASFIHLPVVTLSDNDSKQIAAATSFRMSALFILRTF